MAIDLEFERKKIAALAVFQAKTSETDWRYLVQWPWFLRMQWALGLKTKPKYFNTLMGETIQGLYSCGALLPLVIVGWTSGISFQKVIGFSVLFLTLSALQALAIRSFARKKQLPSWESL